MRHGEACARLYGIGRENSWARAHVRRGDASFRLVCFVFFRALSPPSLLCICECLWGAWLINNTLFVRRERAKEGPENGCCCCSNRKGGRRNTPEDTNNGIRNFKKTRVTTSPNAAVSSKVPSSSRRTVARVFFWVFGVGM